MTGTFLYYSYFSFEVLLFRTWKCFSFFIWLCIRHQTNTNCDSSTWCHLPPFILEMRWVWPSPPSSTSLEEKVRGHAYLPTFLVDQGWGWPWPHSPTPQEKKGRGHDHLPTLLSLPRGEMGPWPSASLLRGVGWEVTMASPLLPPREERPCPPSPLC